MIDIYSKVHDKYAMEMKVRFTAKNDRTESGFDINTWIFLPNTLDINASTYSKEEFYSDVKSKVRFITPLFNLDEIVDNGAVPLNNLKASMSCFQQNIFNAEVILEYEFQLKMFMAIFRSSIRNRARNIVNTREISEIEKLCTCYVNEVKLIRHRFRELKKNLSNNQIDKRNEIQNYFNFGDEFLSYAILQNTFSVLENLEKKNISFDLPFCRDLKNLILEEKSYMNSQGYDDVDKENADINQKVIYRFTMLNKYIESDLILESNKKKDSDGVLAEQVYYSIAAGISMIFTTIIAFSFQQKYGNFTMPLFVALVVSYMLKDRIKELMRFYFAGKLGGKYFDNKTKISIKGKQIGWIKEAVDFITDNKVPEEVLNMRNRSSLLEIENKIHNEKILLYRKRVNLDKGKVLNESTYDFEGVHDIVRLNITKLTQRMDNPKMVTYAIEDKNATKIEKILADKVYYINIITQIKYEDTIKYKRFRIICQRTGILKLEELVI